MNKLISAIAAFSLMAGMVFATATNDLTGGGTGTIPYGAKPAVVLAGVADFAAINGGVSDLYRVIKVPSNCVVTHVWYEVLTTNTVALTCDIGDSTTTNSFITALNASQTNNGTLSTNINPISYMNGTYITLKTISAATTGKIRVKALVIPFN